MVHVRKKRSGLITLAILLLLVGAIVASCLLFVQNFLIFTADGIRLDFGTEQPTRSLNVVVSDKSAFLPEAVPMVLIEETNFPPR